MLICVPPYFCCANCGCRFLSWCQNGKHGARLLQDYHKDMFYIQCILPDNKIRIQFYYPAITLSSGLHPAFSPKRNSRSDRGQNILIGSREVLKLVHRPGIGTFPNILPSVSDPPQNHLLDPPPNQRSKQRPQELTCLHRMWSVVKLELNHIC